MQKSGTEQLEDRKRTTQSAMKVTLVADSTFLFEYEGIRILTDPWIGTQIYGGGWLQFPPPVIPVEDIGRLDYIFISHIHEDHCCPQTIAKLDKSARILLMEKKPNFVEGFLNYHGFAFREVINLRPREIFRATDTLSFEVVEADPAHELNHLIDSSLLIHYGDESIYFANDNPPYPGIYDYLKKRHFKLACVPPAGGSGYPAFYKSLTPVERKEKAEKILQTYQNTMLECLRAVQPEYFLCSASSHVLSGHHAMKTYEMSWAESASAPYAFLAAHTRPEDAFRPVKLKPGMTLDLSEDIGVSYNEAVEFYENKRERDLFIRETASKALHCYELFQVTPLMNFERLFKLAHERLAGVLTRQKIDYDWFYQIRFQRQRLATIALSPPYEMSFKMPLLDSNRLVLEADDRLLYLLLSGGFSWNIADAAGFITYDRKPDRYIYDMYIMLNHFRL